MTSTPERQRGAAYWSAAGLARGVRLAVSGMPVMAVFGLAFGTVAAQKGLTLYEATLMSALVFAGASQFVAVEIWTTPMTATGIAALGFITATVNLRFFLMGAALQPWLGGLPTWQTYPGLLLMTDPGWLLASRYRSEGGADSAVFLGSGVALWWVWIGSTAVGHLIGALVTDPKRFGLDVVMPAFFIVILVPLWRGLQGAIPWAVAGATALLVAKLVPGWWFMVAGAVAGSIAAGVRNEHT